MRWLLSSARVPLRGEEAGGGGGGEEGMSVLEVGAGTGKFTAEILRHSSPSVRVVAVEPVPDMVAALNKTVAAHMDGRSESSVRLLTGAAEALPVADASCDAVFVAQAFHWFANAAAVAELHRVLRPGGRLCLVWNTRDGEAQPWVSRLEALINTLYPADVPRQQSHAWRRFLRDECSEQFGPLRHHRCAFVHEVPPAVVVDRVLSLSVVGQLGEEAQKEVGDRVWALLGEECGATRDGEAPHGWTGLPYACEAYVCERL